MVDYQTHKPPIGNQMKHLLILLSLLFLTLPLVAQETGVLYFKKVNDKFGWFENGNEKKDWKYIGEIRKGKPNGTGVLSSTSGKYSGELKNGMKHGQGTYTYKSGRKRVGEFRKGKPWNVKSYDKNGKIETEWVKGIKLKKVAQETGVLYFKKVNGKFGWFENGDDKKDWKYVGEIKNGKPNGTGVLSSTSGKYSGEVKNGMKHGQGTYTYKSGRERVGEFRKGKPWNVNNYDKNGKIEAAWIKGIKLKWVKGIKLKKEEAPLEEKGHTENKSYKIGVRALLGNTSGKISTSNSSFSLIWENYGLGFNQMSFKTTYSNKNTPSKNDVYEMKNSSLDLSYTIGENWILTTGAGYVYGGKGSITSASSPIKYETESVSGFGLFGLLGMVWEGLEGLIGVRYYSTNYTDFNSTNTSEVSTLVKAYPISDAQLIFGLGYSF
jgi:hypothetical protein